MIEREYSYVCKYRQVGKKIRGKNSFYKNRGDSSEKNGILLIPNQWARCPGLLTVSAGLENTTHGEYKNRSGDATWYRKVKLQSEEEKSSTNWSDKTQGKNTFREK